MSLPSIPPGPRCLRAGWRFLLFVLSFTLLANALLLAIRAVGYRPEQGMAMRDLLVADGASFAACAAVTLLLGRLESRPFGDFGLPARGAFGVHYWQGIACGTVTVASIVVIIWMTGGVRVDGFALHGGELAVAALGWGATMIVLGLFEELAFRGYPLVALSEGMGFWPAAVLLSALFGALHYFAKPLENVIDATAVALIGLFLAFTFRRSGTLWFAAGFHAAFDWAALILFGAPNTGNGGLPLAGHLLATTFDGPVWLTGGPRGVEASIVTFPVMLLLFLLYSRLETSKRRDPALGTRWLRPPATNECRVPSAVVPERQGRT